MPSSPAQESELILKPDGRVYHLNVKGADVADHVILVGDPARVDRVASHFDELDYTSASREFNVRTGKYKGTRITVLSTGIGCDNLDIVVTELDAAVNVDPETRQVHPQLRHLNLIRLGTCGALQGDLNVDSTIVSAAVLGLDGVAHFYNFGGDIKDDNDTLAQAFMHHVKWPERWNRPYARRASPSLLAHFGDLGTKGLTLTSNGFFGPQGRSIRLPLALPDMNERFRGFTTSEGDLRVTNYEMECSALYALGQALGHCCLTMCVVLANRYAGTFSKDYHAPVDKLIVDVLDKITTL